MKNWHRLIKVSKSKKTQKLINFVDDAEKKKKTKPWKLSPKERSKRRHPLRFTQLLATGAQVKCSLQVQTEKNGYSWLVPSHFLGFCRASKGFIWLAMVFIEFKRFLKGFIGF